MPPNTSDGYFPLTPPLMSHCRHANDTIPISAAFLVTRLSMYALLSILIFCLGYRRWRRQRSVATTSHSDIFTYHAAASQLLFVLWCPLYLWGELAGLPVVRKVGAYVSSMISPGELSFHMLTCVERYLAVVHPVTYLRLRQSGGVRIRNISIGCVWLLCFGWMGVTDVFYPKIPVIPSVCMLAFSVVVVSFCSLSVLRVLTRPGPGDGHGDKRRVDQSKQKAFQTISAIMVVLLVFFLGFLVALALEESKLLGPHSGCLLLVSVNWLSLPCGVVLPLLFLNRAGKLSCLTKK